MIQLKNTIYCTENRIWKETIIYMYSKSIWGIFFFKIQYIMHLTLQIFPIRHFKRWLTQNILFPRGMKRFLVDVFHYFPHKNKSDIFSSIYAFKHVRCFCACMCINIYINIYIYTCKYNMCICVLSVLFLKGLQEADEKTYPTR